MNRHVDERSVLESFQPGGDPILGAQLEELGQVEEEREEHDGEHVARDADPPGNGKKLVTFSDDDISSRWRRESRRFLQSKMSAVRFHF